MAEGSWPSPTHVAVTSTEFEQLAHPTSADGAVGVPADSSVVFGDGTGTTRQVKIRPEKFALVRGRAWYSGAAEFTKSHAANSSGQTRIDVVVLRLTRSTWQVTTEIVQGTPGNPPPVPALTQDTGTTGVFEIPLAEVTVLNGATAITADKVVRREYYLGELPIVCDPANLPPHRLGRVVFRTDGVVQWSNGSTWITFYEDTGWLAGLQPGTGWTIASGDYRRRNGAVTVNLVAERSGTSIAANQSILVTTLPSGFRPTVPLFTTGFSSQGMPVRVRINTDGTVRMDGFASVFNSGSFLTVSTLTFPA